MAKIDMKEFEEYQSLLESVFKDTERLIRDAVYDGGKIVADEIKAGLKALPIEEGKNSLPPIGTSEHKLTGVSRRQKGDLIDSFGLAPIEKEGDFINTKAGVDGYGSIPTKKYPNGTPNVMLMRSIESGTSFREKHPVFRPAVNRSRKKAIEAMRNKFDEQIKKKMEG